MSESVKVSVNVSVSVNMSVGQEAPHLESIGHFEHVLERYGPCLALRRLLKYGGWRGQTRRAGRWHRS